MSARTGPDVRVAIVTGGGGGLGLAIGRELAADGLRVVLADRDVAAAREAASRLADVAGGERARAYELDVTDPDSVSRLVRGVGERFGRIDVVVNNAGIETTDRLEELDLEHWDATMDVNARGPMLMCRASVPFWRRQRTGCVVNVGSRTWLSGGNAAYVSSKAALVGLTRSLATELGPLGVRANLVAPSFVRTNLSYQKGDDAFVDEYSERFRKITPLGRLVEPADIGHAVAFLASEKARAITGEVLHVCAGSQLAPIVR